MKILVIAEDLRYPIDEGMKNVAWRITSALAERHPLLCITSFPPAEDRDYLIRIPLNKMFLSASLFKEIRGFRPDMIVYFPEASITRNSFFRAKVLRRASNCFTVLAALQPRKYGWMFRKVMPWVRPDLVVASSEGFASELSSLGLPAESLPPGVDTERFRPVDPSLKAFIRKKLGLPQDLRVVLHVGHLKSTRNLSDLARFASMGGYLPVLVGSTSTQKERGVEESLCEKGVRIVSEYVVGIEEYYQATDLYLFPVKDPTAAIDFPLSVLEAMSTGIPVLTRPFGALSDTFPGGIGIEYYRGEDEIRPKAEMLLDQDPIKVTESQRKRIEGFSWNKVAQRLISLASNRMRNV